jgi:hypothetical protein
MAPRTTPAICLGPTGNLQGSYFFFSLVTGQIIRRRKWSELPVPDAVIERVAHFAQKSGSLPGLKFSDCHHQEYHWSENVIVGSEDPPAALYPDIRADIPGVQLDREPSSLSFNNTNITDGPNFTTNDDPDWAQMADDALANADIDDTEVLPPPPEVIIIDDDEDVPLPPPIRQKLVYLPKVEPDESPPSPTPLPYSLNVRRNATRAPPQRFVDYHLFTTVADDVDTSFPYIDAHGRKVDLAITDKHHIAQVCHYVMLHCAETTFVGDPNNKKQYGLKAGLKKFVERGNAEVIQTGFMLCRDTRTCSHSYKAPPLAPKRGSRHISRILDGYVVSSMSFSVLKTISPPILDSTEVIHTGFMLCRDTRTRSHSYKAPPQAPKRGSRHISRILDGYIVSSMSFSVLKTISPPILDSTEVIQTGFMLCRDTRTRSHSYKAPPQAPKRGSRHICRILDGFTCIFFDFCPFLKKKIWLCQECTH